MRMEAKGGRGRREDEDAEDAAVRVEGTLWRGRGKGTPLSVRWDRGIQHTSVERTARAHPPPALAHAGGAGAVVREEALRASRGPSFSDRGTAQARARRARLTCLAQCEGAGLAVYAEASV